MMIIFKKQKRNNNNNEIKKKRKKNHWSCENEPEAPYKAQHYRYYLHKNIMLILILCPIYN